MLRKQVIPSKKNKKMKKLSILSFAVLSIFCFSCSDYLDKQPDDMLTINDVFAKRLEAEKYLASIYSFLPDEAGPYDNLSPISDEADFVWTGIGANNINTGNWSPTSIPYNPYTHYYKAIRSASVYINQVDKCLECETVTPGINIRTKAEARALRAYYYFLLMRQYGPVVILPEIIPVDASNNDTQLPRNSYDECVKYITTELDLAAKELPAAQTNVREYGRIDQRVAMAIKARVLLYGASPLFNGNNQDFEDFKNAKDGKKLITNTYDANKWKLAADAAKAVIDMMPTGLYKKMDTNGRLDPFTSYRDLFVDRWNNEVIWARPSTRTNEFTQHAAPRQMKGWNGLGITQQMVDAYHMDNGRLINESGSGYVESGFSTANTKYTKVGDWNMYLNREPRFYVSVLYNHDEWPFSGNKNYTPIQLYATGLSGRNGSHDHTETGYLLTKFVSADSDVPNGRYTQQAWIFFRLGEMYLNYAEALNEYSAGNPDIAKYVNLIRERAGLPVLPSGLSQAEMRQKIQHERRIELAFEGHRVFDVRRWKIAEATQGGPMYGMNVNKGTNFNDTDFYQRVVFETRVFQKKHYFWPIQQSEIDRNREMLQNPGW